MGTLIPTVIGVAVSVGLFYIGYRQTIGARKERVRAANSDIEKILLKRIVAESCCPTVAELSRIIEAKAREHNVRANDLYSEGQLLNTVFTKIVETDFITPNTRNEILKPLTDVLVQAEARPIEESTLFEYASERQQSWTTWLLAVIAFLAVSLGTLMSVVPSIFGSQKFELSPVLITVVTGLILIAVIVAVYRFSEYEEESKSSSDSQRSSIGFEQEVLRVLEKAGMKIFMGGTSRDGYDFLIELGGKKILIEVKNWVHQMPLEILNRLIARLDSAVST